MKPSFFESLLIVGAVLGILAVTVGPKAAPAPAPSAPGPTGGDMIDPTFTQGVNVNAAPAPGSLPAVEVSKLNGHRPWRY